MKTEALEAGARQIRLRCGDRRGAARRGKEPRQGADLFVPRPRPCAGTRGTSGRNSGASTTRASRPARSMRVFPLSNWTELDVWDYIEAEKHPGRAAVFRQGSGRSCSATASGSWSMTTGCRCDPGETPELRLVRFRTLGCYPLTGAIESEAATVAEIVAELRQARTLGAAGPADRQRRRRLDGAQETARGISDARRSDRAIARDRGASAASCGF